MPAKQKGKEWTDADYRNANVGITNPDHARRFRESTQEIFGRSLAPGEVHALLGVPSGSVVHAVVNGPEVRLKAWFPEGFVERSFERSGGRVIAHHELLKMREDSRGKGTATSMLRSQFDSYTKLGVNEVRLTAAWDGRYIWPKMGWGLRRESEFAEVRESFDKYVRRTGGRPASIPGTTVQELARSQYGKGFFLSEKGPTMDLVLDLQGSDGAALRRKLGL